jgi:hypothetical protein
MKQYKTNSTFLCAIVFNHEFNAFQLSVINRTEDNMFMEAENFERFNFRNGWLQRLDWERFQVLEADFFELELSARKLLALPSVLESAGFPTLELKVFKWTRTHFCYHLKLVEHLKDDAGRTLGLPSSSDGQENQNLPRHCG